MTAEMLSIEELSFSYGDNRVLDCVSLDIKPGTVTALMGANACGKTTLLNLMTKNLKPDAGRVLLGGRDIAGIKLRELARRAAIVHQKNSAPDDLIVKKLVAYGRIPHSSMLRGKTGLDDERIAQAIEATGIADIAERPMGSLSGGQRQRAFIAMALAQDTRLLFLDEPTTFLDVRYQVEILRLIRSLNVERGITIVMVLHDINQALAYSDEVIGLRNGKILAQGSPREVIDSDMIFSLYGIRLDVKTDGQHMWVLPV
ncbi:MAG: ABC transporter ATP-binding protein [Oscillospiraceae bacterium]|jgi:iron complex transport system ATP-binding protein|nr:ABC transporter ATP-binding protein [Oscillospiraceae bacterium]